MQPCQVSRILRESCIFLVNSHFSACQSFISCISFFCLLHIIFYSSNRKLFTLITTSELNMFKNAVVAQALPQTPTGELNYSILQNSKFWRKIRNGLEKKKWKGQ